MVINMGLEKMIKREIGITIATVLLVTTVFLMFSYAIFKVDVSGDTNVLSFGDIAMSFCADSACNTTIENIGNVIGTEKYTNSSGEIETKYVPVYPQADPTTIDEWNSLKPYTFLLENTGTLDLYVKIFLKRDTTPGKTYTVDFNGSQQTFTEPVDDNQIKIAIGERGATPTIKLFSDTVEDSAASGQIIAEDILIEAGQSKIFDLYAWLKSDAANAAQGKYFVSQISARGEFIPKD